MDYQYQIGDLVRREHIGEPEQMFMFDAKNLGIIVEVHEGTPGIKVYWQASKRNSYYSLSAACQELKLVAKAD